MNDFDGILHDTITERIYDHNVNTVLFPVDVSRIARALREMMGQHFTNACTARMKHDTKNIVYHEEEYEAYIDLYERIIGEPPFQPESEEAS